MEPEKISARGGLWAAALDYYQREGVEALCLQLQDDFGLDVPCLLALAWAVNAGKRLESPLLPVLNEALTFARDYIYPLRTLRRQAGESGPRGFYESLKATELEGERHQLSLLENALAACLEVGAGHCISEAFALYAAETRALPQCQAGLEELAKRLTHNSG